MVEMCEVMTVTEGAMKASDIITALQDLIKLHGDLYVYSLMDCDFIGEARFEQRMEDRPKRWPNDNIKPDRFVFD